MTAISRVGLLVVHDARLAARHLFAVVWVVMLAFEVARVWVARTAAIWVAPDAIAAFATPLVLALALGHVRTGRGAALPHASLPVSTAERGVAALLLWTLIGILPAGASQLASGRPAGAVALDVAAMTLAAGLLLWPTLEPGPTRIARQLGVLAALALLARQADISPIFPLCALAIGLGYALIHHAGGWAPRLATPGLDGLVSRSRRATIAMGWIVVAAAGLVWLQYVGHTGGTLPSGPLRPDAGWWGAHSAPLAVPVPLGWSVLGLLGLMALPWTGALPTVQARGRTRTFAPLDHLPVSRRALSDALAREARLRSAAITAPFALLLTLGLWHTRAIQQVTEVLPFALAWVGWVWAAGLLLRVGAWLQSAWWLLLGAWTLACPILLIWVLWVALLPGALSTSAITVCNLVFLLAMVGLDRALRPAA